MQIIDSERNAHTVILNAAEGEVKNLIVCPQRSAMPHIAKTLSTCQVLVVAS